MVDGTCCATTIARLYRPRDVEPPGHVIDVLGARDERSGVLRRARAGRLLAVLLIAGGALAACGGPPQPDLTKMSVRAILRLAVRDARHAPNVALTISSPATLQREVEDAHFDVRGFATSRYGVVHVVRWRTNDSSQGTSYFRFDTTFIRSHFVMPGILVVASQLHAAEITLGSHWLSGDALRADPAAVRAATTMFLATPRSLLGQLFNPLVAANATRGGVVTFDHVRSVPLTLSSTGEVLFVSVGPNPRAVGASVPLGASSSPVLFLFSYPTSVAIQRPPSITRACDLRNADGSRPVLAYFGAVRCPA